MKLEEILSFLEDESKRESLIYKLKHAGENSKQAHALKEIITSFNLHKTRKEIFQTNILQTTFRYCDPKECFTQFRLVCKTWQNAVESIRFEENLEIAPLTEFVENVALRNSYAKYMKRFENIEIDINDGFVSKWDIITKYLTDHLTKIKNLWVDCHLDDKPSQLDAFLKDLLETSQHTLKEVYVDTGRIELADGNLIPLSNLSTLSLYMYPNFDNQIPKFDRFIKTVISNCEHFQNFILSDLDHCPNIMQHLKENYGKHCIISNTNIIQDILPVKMGFAQPLSKAQQCAYPYMIQSLSVAIDPDFPSIGGWENYKTILSLFPNLKTIRLLIKINEHVGYEDAWQDLAFDSISIENRNIWEERISYLNSKEIVLINTEQRAPKFEELCKKVNWGFSFYAIVD